MERDREHLRLERSDEHCIFVDRGIVVDFGEAVAATLARPDFDARVPRRRLIIISDMLEHEKGGYSQLKGGDLWGAWRASPLVHTARLDLRGVAVAIDYLMRGQYAAVRGQKHRDFWHRLFTEAGAAEVTFVGLQPPAATPAITNEERLVKRVGRN